MLKAKLTQANAAYNSKETVCERISGRVFNKADDGVMQAAGNKLIRISLTIIKLW